MKRMKDSIQKALREQPEKTKPGKRVERKEVAPAATQETETKAQKPKK